MFTDASVGFVDVDGTPRFVAGLAWKIKRSRRSTVGAVAIDGITTSNLAELLAVCLAVRALCDRLPAATAARSTLALYTDNEYALKVVREARPSDITASHGLCELLGWFAGWSIEIRKDTACAHMAHVDRLSRATMKARRSELATNQI